MHYHDAAIKKIQDDRIDRLWGIIADVRRDRLFKLVAMTEGYHAVTMWCSYQLTGKSVTNRDYACLYGREINRRLACP